MGYSEDRYRQKHLDILSKIERHLKVIASKDEDENVETAKLYASDIDGTRVIAEAPIYSVPFGLDEVPEYKMLCEFMPTTIPLNYIREYTVQDSPRAPYEKTLILRFNEGIPSLRFTVNYATWECRIQTLAAFLDYSQN